MAVRAVIYGAAGWILEVLWTGLGSLAAGDPRLASHTYLWMFPIYSLAVFLEPVHDFIRKYNPVVRGSIYVILIFSVEYFTGWVLEMITGFCPWHYDSGAAVDGYIRLDYAPVWFALGLLFERLHDFLDLITAK